MSLAGEDYESGAGLEAEPATDGPVVVVQVRADEPGTKQVQREE